MKIRSQALLLPGVVLFLSGCSYITRSYVYKPTPIERANSWMLKDSKGDARPLTMPTDAHIVAFTNDLKQSFRKRMYTAALARHLSSTIQVLTAASAATLSGLEGASRSAITVLAATSTVMPQLQTIFDARGAAIALEQGAALIDEAEAHYYETIARNPISDPNARITPEGAQLYVRAVAAVQIVEKLLVAQLPTLEQMKIVKGETVAELATLHQNVYLELAAPKVESGKDPVFTPTMSQVAISGAKVQVAASAQLAVAETSFAEHAVTITAKKPGQTTVTVGLEDGTQRVFPVTAYVPLTLSATQIELARLGEEGSVTATGQRVIEARLDNEAVAQLVTAPSAAALAAEVRVRSLVNGPRVTMLFLRGEHGGTRTVPVYVKSNPQ
ncbi:MAG: hypothetical protein HY736_21300 [Verrucomicrobia bacterium]|nr:hypothetical protein [Verrucomicrobiota bacterium]